MARVPPDSIEVGGRVVKVTNPGRVLYPEDGVTKADVITYYVHVSERLLPHVRRRPVTRIRWPHGVDKERFFEKNLPSHAPKWMDRITLHHSDGDVTYPLVDEVASLAWLAQQNALELHVPQWRIHGEGRRVDRLVIDLDPGPKAGLAECIEVSLWLRERLQDAGMDCVPVTSGSKGLHLYAKWRASDHDDSSSSYAKKLANAATRQFPSLVTANMAKKERDGKVLLDWSQNNPNKTTITPYSLRGRAHPFVATPRWWSELEAGGVQHLVLSEVLERLSDADPLEVLL